MTEPLEVQKLAGFVQVSCCVLTDYTGVNHCTHPAAPPLSRRFRVRFWFGERWRSLRKRVGFAIAGHDPRDYDE